MYQYDRPGTLVDSRFNLKYPELFSELKRLMRMHAPKFKYNSIQQTHGLPKFLGRSEHVYVTHEL